MTPHEVEIALIAFPWPLIIAIEDCFVPEFAPIVLEAAQEYGDETCGLMWALAGMRAREEIQQN